MSIGTEIWSDIGTKVGALRRSRSARDSAGNAAYSVADTFIRPALMVAASPYLVYKLGMDLFGIWMLVNALSGTYSVFNLGLGDATMKFVSAYLGRRDANGVIRIVRASFSLTCFIGAALALLVFFIAPVLAHSVFKIAPALQLLTIRAIRIGGLLLALRAVESIFTAGIRAHERYDIAARVTMMTKVGALVLAVILAALGFGVLAILFAVTAATLTSVVAQAISLKRLQPQLSLALNADRTTWREMAHFGTYTWLQNAAGTVFDQMDRLLIGVFLGTSAVAQFAICLQLAQPIHMLASSAFNFVFPLFSNRRESGDSNVASMFRIALIANLALTLLMAIPLILCAKPILTLWMGAVFASQAHVVMSVLAIGYTVLSINVVPYYSLLASGDVRFVSITNLVGGALSIFAALLLIPHFSTMGAALSRLAYGPAVSLNFFKIRSSLKSTEAAGVGDR